jgi:hypothetical protein
MSHLFTAPGIIATAPDSLAGARGSDLSRGREGAVFGLFVRNLLGHPKKNGSPSKCEVFNNVRGGARRFGSTSRQSLTARLGSLSANPRIAKNGNTHAHGTYVRPREADRLPCSAFEGW